MRDIFISVVISIVLTIVAQNVGMCVVSGLMVAGFAAYVYTRPEVKTKN